MLCCYAIFYARGKNLGENLKAPLPDSRFSTFMQDYSRSLSLFSGFPHNAATRLILGRYFVTKSVT